MDIRPAPTARFHIVAALALVLGLGAAGRATAQSSAPSGPEADTQSATQPMTDEEYRQKLQALHWVDGPKDLPALGNATLSLPDHYIFLDDADTKKFMVLNENPPDSGAEQLFAPDDLHWFALIDFSADGYVKDDEKIDADAILAGIKEGNEAANAERRKNGWGEVEIVGWKKAPYYDEQTKRLEWALEAREERGETINFLTKILGRRGVTSAILVAEPDHFDSDLAEFKQVLTHYTFNPGEKYSEYKAGDKIASYGLAALIAGGAAAVATKVGFWKWLGLALAASWKFIWVPIVAAFAGLKRLFRRRRDY
ncbi:MAG TPA: DUF2167 domain-containing protein [Dongiaceae bacterium]|nr:DUF2167 domain-containing protein [Dongiaceae bacterium]